MGKMMWTGKKSGISGNWYLILFLIPSLLFSQPYAPAAGMSGTSAIHKDSSIFVNWAIGSTIIRGYQDVSNPPAGKTSVGDSTMVSGKALTNGVVSLGDGGQATCYFSYPIKNGPGFDFAVFENSIDDTFLELAFVEVSSDGSTFVRFPAHSLTDTMTQTGSFGATNATKINNLAGKYRAGYGTPFDLQELTAFPNLNTDQITHVRIVDVVGSLLPQYVTRDSYSNKVNDPWPTAFASGGFDLDAIGVINENKISGLQQAGKKKTFKIFPNPAQAGELIKIETEEPILRFEILTCDGKRMNCGSGSVTSPELPGLYVLKLYGQDHVFVHKIIVYRR